MKKTQEVIGLPVISISEAVEVGKVKDIIINADRGAIDYVIVDSGIQVLGVRIISAENIMGIGEYALTIENAGVINDISKVPEAMDLLQKDIRVKSTGILTRKGRLVGETGDFYIDEDERCYIIGLEYIADKSQDGIKLIPRKSVITFGKKLIVVEEDMESNLVNNAAELISRGGLQEDEKKNNSLASCEAACSTEVLTGEIPCEGINIQDNSVNEAPDDSGSSGIPDMQQVLGPQEDSGAAELFEQKQREYLKGRKTKKTITDDAGNIIIAEGVMIDDTVIDIAKQKGKLIDLIMNNKS